MVVVLSQYLSPRDRQYYCFYKELGSTAFLYHLICHFSWLRPSHTGVILPYLDAITGDFHHIFHHRDDEHLRTLRR